MKIENNFNIYNNKTFIQHLITEHKCDICNNYCNDFYSFKLGTDVYNGHENCYLNLLNSKEKSIK